MGGDSICCCCHRDALIWPSVNIVVCTTGAFSSFFRVCLHVSAYACVCVVWICACVNVFCRPLMWCFWCLWVFKGSINMLMCSGRTQGPCGPLAAYTLGICGFVYRFLWRCELHCSSFCSSTQTCNFPSTSSLLSLTRCTFYLSQTLITHAYCHTYTSLLKAVSPLGTRFDTLSVFESRAVSKLPLALTFYFPLQTAHTRCFALTTIGLRSI